MTNPVQAIKQAEPPVLTNVAMTPDELSGVRAIIHLQSLAGITEPHFKALSEWRKMSMDDRLHTLFMASLLSSKKEKK